MLLGPEAGLHCATPSRQTLYRSFVFRPFGDLRPKPAVRVARKYDGAPAGNVGGVFGTAWCRKAEPYILQYRSGVNGTRSAESRPPTFRGHIGTYCTVWTPHKDSGHQDMHVNPDYTARASIDQHCSAQLEKYDRRCTIELCGNCNDPL